MFQSVLEFVLCKPTDDFCEYFDDYYDSFEDRNKYIEDELGISIDDYLEVQQKIKQLKEKDNYYISEPILFKTPYEIGELNDKLQNINNWHNMSQIADDLQYSYHLSIPFNDVHWFKITKYDKKLHKELDIIPNEIVDIIEGTFD